MDFVPLIIDAIAYAAITTKQRLTNHTGAIPGKSPWISIISIKPSFAIANAFHNSIDQTLQFIWYIFWYSHNFLMFYKVYPFTELIS